MIQEGVVFDFGYWTVKPGLEDLFLEKWQNFAQWTLNHFKGIRWIYMVRDQERGNEFISFAPWDSPESIAEWRRSSKYIAVFDELNNLCEGIEPVNMVEVTHVKR